MQTEQEENEATALWTGFMEADGRKIRMFGFGNEAPDYITGARYFDARRKSSANGVDPILQFFKYNHLPPHLQPASAPFMDLALRICETLPRNPERTVALRKLLEAKDAAVRASIFVTEPPGA